MSESNRFEAYSAVNFNGFDIRAYADRVEINRWCLPDGEPGELGQRIVIPRKTWDGIVDRVAPMLRHKPITARPSVPSDGRERAS